MKHNKIGATKYYAHDTLRKLSGVRQVSGLGTKFLESRSDCVQRNFMTFLQEHKLLAPPLSRYRLDILPAVYGVLDTICII